MRPSYLQTLLSGLYIISVISKEANELKKDSQSVGGSSDEKAKLTNAGFFAYSREEGTPSYKFQGQVEESVKQERVKKLYMAQKRISKKILSEYVGKTIEVLADGINYDKQAFEGRCYFSAPEIDGKVYFTSDSEVNQGEKYLVKIEKADAYDLYGGVEDEFTE